MATAYIALGANLGDRQETLRRAVDALGTTGRIAAVSSLYETVPVGYLDQPMFLNATIRFETDLLPFDLLQLLHQIEANEGRVRTFTNAPRTLDLDLLLYDDVVIDRPDLIVPHPRLHLRAFVLAPLSEIANDVVHPVAQTTVAELWQQWQVENDDPGIAQLPELLMPDLEPID